MEIFKVKKTYTQLEASKSWLYFWIICLILLTWVFRNEVQSRNIFLGAIVFFIGLSLIKTRNEMYLIIRSDGVTFRDKRSISWHIALERVDNMEYKTVHFHSFQSKKVLVNLIFNCNDGDSYSTGTNLFSEEQAQEMQLALKSIKDETLENKNLSS